MASSADALAAGVGAIDELLAANDDSQDKFLVQLSPIKSAAGRAVPPGGGEGRNTPPAHR